MNHAREIANMLGLEIGEKFKIKGHPDYGTFWFVEDDFMGMRDLWDCDMGPALYEEFENVNDLLEQLLTGFYEVEKLQERNEIVKDTTINTYKQVIEILNRRYEYLWKRRHCTHEGEGFANGVLDSRMIVQEMLENYKREEK